jgi:hypothetical protein
MLVQESLSLLDGAVFDSRDTCPACGGQLSGYDSRERQFARIREDMVQRTITVTVKRFRCRSCGRICNADEPFYPDTRIGAPVIDLCIVLSQVPGYGRAARNLSAMGLEIDRMQCRHFARTPVHPIAVMDIFGFLVPQSIISLSEIAARTGEGGCIKGAEALAASGFPSTYRAAPHRPVPEDEGDQRDKEDNKEDRQVEEPHHDGERE